MALMEEETSSENTRGAGSRGRRVGLRLDKRDAGRKGYLRAIFSIFEDIKPCRYWLDSSVPLLPRPYIESAATSALVRDLQFWNSHPSKSRPLVIICIIEVQVLTEIPTLVIIHVHRLLIQSWDQHWLLKKELLWKCMSLDRWTEVIAPMIRVVWSWSERTISEREYFGPITEAGFG